MAALAALLLAAEATTPAPDPAALAREVLSLAATGDPVPMERARALVPDALRSDASYRSAAAGRAMAGLLLAAELRERSAALPDGEAGLRDARARKEAALDELRTLFQAAPEDPDVLRGLALYYGVDGRPAEEAALAAAAREAGIPSDDPWLSLSALLAGLRGRPAAEAEPVLAAFVAAHPAQLPPRLSLARVRVALGDPDGALAALDGLLAADPDHDAARELKATLLAPPPVRAITPAVPSAAPPPTAPGWLPRKKGATAARPASPPGS
ncbi:MAG TPA: tetratricopeptide repeat protein [Anaeromyxobacteraceae bacterium]|nr:tetratricopeptide repeat protein [Anaeromyxobacteraceae bacterium]